MRLVVTSDTHRYVDPSKIPDGDVFLHCGDLMSTGYLDDWREQLNWLRQLPHKRKIYVPGNHDMHMEVFTGPALQDMRSAGVTVLGIHGNSQFYWYHLPNGYSIVGLPYVTALPRWAFNLEYSEVMDRINEHLTMGNNQPMPGQSVPLGKMIVASHSPIAGIMDGSHTGINYYNQVLAKYQPRYWFHGHVHERYGHHRSDATNTDIYNVAMSDRLGNHANAPVVIDLL